MNLLLIIAGAGLILAAGLLLKGRKNQADRNARYRAPRTALNLDRASAGLGRSGGRSQIPPKARPSSSPAAPIILGVVLVVLSLWLAAAYLRPSAESSEAAAAARTSSPPPQATQVGTLAGRLSTPEPPAAPAAPAAGQQPTAQAAPTTTATGQQPTAPAAPTTAATNQQPTAPADGAIAAALSQTAAQADGSALSQVGLMPTRRTTTFTPSAQAAPASAPKPAPEPARRPAAETQPAGAPKPDQPPPPPPPASPPANSSLVRALADPPPGGAGASEAPGGGGRSGILSGMEGFTVHLGSFMDQANAEKFRAKLAAAGEPAAISEFNLDGRRWYRVLSGRFDTRTAADAHGRDLRRRGLTDDTGPFIVKPINSDN